jgi:drug/metabolite transporter (DMT)-like permease
MWTLFTTALARGNSTTQVSIMNTSANFVITAILGFAIFSEALPPLWWLGAAMLVAGNVIIGRKDEGGAPKEGGEEEVGDADGDGGEGITLASGSGEGEGLSPLRSRGGVLVDVGSGEEEEEEEKSEDEDVADLRL